MILPGLLYHNHSLLADLIAHPAPTVNYYRLKTVALGAKDSRVHPLKGTHKHFQAAVDGYCTFWI